MKKRNGKLRFSDKRSHTIFQRSHSLIGIVAAVALTITPTVGASASWNTVEGVTTAQLAADGAKLISSSIGQTERGEVLATFWRVEKGDLQLGIYRCFEVARYVEGIEVKHCQIAQY